MLKTLIADLDGTLVKCGRYYNAINEDIATIASEQFGCAPAQVHELAGVIDLWAVKAGTKGFTRERYPLAMAATVAAISIMLSDGTVDPALLASVYQKADGVFDAPYEPFAGAVETLKRYKYAGWQVIIYTKGDTTVQRRKAINAGLESIADAIVVVPQKDVETLQTLIQTYTIDVSTSVYVGDSLRDDIAPAALLDLSTVRIHPQPEDLWRGYDLEEDLLSDADINAFADLPDVLPIEDDDNDGWWLDEVDFALDEDV